MFLMQIFMINPALFEFRALPTKKITSTILHGGQVVRYAQTMENSHA